VIAEPPLQRRLPLELLVRDIGGFQDEIANAPRGVVIIGKRLRPAVSTERFEHAIARRVGAALGSGHREEPGGYQPIS